MDNFEHRKKAKKHNDHESYSRKFATSGSAHPVSINESRERVRMRQQQQTSNDKYINLPPLKDNKAANLFPNFGDRIDSNTYSVRVPQPQSWTSQKYFDDRKGQFGGGIKKYQKWHLPQDRNGCGKLGEMEMRPGGGDGISIAGSLPHNMPSLKRSDIVQRLQTTEIMSSKEIVRLPKLEDNNYPTSQHRQSYHCNEKRTLADVNLPYLKDEVGPRPHPNDCGDRQTFDSIQPHRRPDTPHPQHMHRRNKETNKFLLSEEDGETKSRYLNVRNKDLRDKLEGRNALSGRTAKTQAKSDLNKKSGTTEVNLVIDVAECQSNQRSISTHSAFTRKSIQPYVQQRCLMSNNLTRSYKQVDESTRMKALLKLCKNDSKTVNVI